MSTPVAEKAVASLAKGALTEASSPACAECPIAKVGIYSSTMKSSPQTIAGLRTKTISYPANRTILREGQSSELFGSLRSGWAYAYKTLPDGRRHIPGFLIPGDTIILDLLQIGPFPVSFGVKALTNASVCWFPAASMRRLLLEEKGQRRETQYWMAYYMAGLHHRAAAIAQSDARGRIAEFLVEMLRRQRDHNVAKGDVIEFPPTQEQVADCLGMTPVHVSRTLTHLKRRGILEIRDKTLRIFDERELISIAEERHG